LSDIPRERVGDFERELFDYIKGSHEDWMAAIKDSGSLSPEGEQQLLKMINHTKERFVK
jgi:F-type H+-transporting ATPase subunit alpha